jgi:signal transduction histidine kinase
MSLLPKSHRILERPLMEFRPFGKDRQGATIQNVSGITVRANLEYLETLVTCKYGPESAQAALEKLVGLLNERIPDRTYHVTVDFLKNPWNSYSYEFVMFLTEFSIQLSEQPDYHFNLGREKLLSPLVQILGRPFSIVQIYRLFPYFAEKFAKGSLKTEVVSVTNGHAVIRLQFAESVLSQFGPYLRGCAERICHTSKASLAQIPASMFGQQPATIQDTCCIAEGDPYCEWIFRWSPQSSPLWAWMFAGVGLSLLMLGLTMTLFPHYPWWGHVGLSLLPLFIMPLTGRIWIDRKELQERGTIIQEQLASAEHQHEELRSAYLQQEQSLVDVRRHVDELTMLHELTLQISSTLDQEDIIQAGLKAIVRSLQYDQAWIALWDEEHHQFHKIHAYGGPQTWPSDLRGLTIPATPHDLLSTTLKRPQPTIIEDVQRVLASAHPTTRQLLTEGQLQRGIALALVSQKQPLGVLVAGHHQTKILSPSEQNLLATVAKQLTIALDTALAYEEIEALNIGLETKVQERTTALQQANQELETANTRLKELDRMKSQFLSHCSHELRTPLTSIKGFTENMLHGLVGPIAERQHLYLTRISANANRLTRMIGDLLDLSRIEAGTVRLAQQFVSLPTLLEDITQEFMPLTQTKNQELRTETTGEDLMIWGDPDRLHQIVTNLVHNAHKFTPDHGRILVTASPEPPNHILLSIADSGPGIPQEALAHLFQAFYQAHRRPEIGTEGLGLGLSIVKQLVELHGATITVESTVSAGTTFHIRFPNIASSETSTLLI